MRAHSEVVHGYGSHRNYKHRQYEEVGRNQVYLTEEEEIKLVNWYEAARNRLHYYIISKRKCRQWYLDLYRETKAARRSVAKLSSKFNPRVKGLSAKIEASMEVEIERLYCHNPAGHHAAHDVIYQMNTSEIGRAFV